VIELIQLHLLSLGLTTSAMALNKESNVGLSCSILPLQQLAHTGAWGEVLTSLDRLDVAKRAALPPDLILDVQEMTVLELIESGDLQMAKLAIRALDGGDNIFIEERKQRIDTAFVSLKEIQDSQQSATFYGTITNPSYTKQLRRDAIGQDLASHVPVAPTDRLVTLLTQSIKWQKHTGTLPTLRPVDSDDPAAKTPQYDLVNGNPPESATETKGGNKGGTNKSAPQALDRAPSQQYGVIKFSKKTHAESATFLPDGAGLVTGSTDGFVEVYDHTTCKLNMDFAYQANEEIMLHDTNVLSITYSADGEMIATGDSKGCVKVWGVQQGKCVREFPQAHNQGVLCLKFGKDGSKLITGAQDGLLREFGLRSSKLLQEFRGHGSYVNCVDLVSDDQFILSGSSDGTVRVWHHASGECLKTLTLPVEVGSSSNNASIQSIIPIDNGANFIVVPRGNMAYVMSRDTGAVLREFKSDRGGDFVCATVSPRGRFLYAVTDDHVLQSYDIATGAIERTIEVAESEVLGIAAHPFKNIVGTWSNEGNRGKLKLWIP